MGRAVIYGRQSRTRDGSESLATQDESCTQACERQGHTVVARLFEPPSTSAYKRRGLGRPEWARLLAMIASGQADTIMTYRTDRLSRGGGPGWAPLLDAAERAGLDVDRFVATPAGWVSEFEIGIRATMDREEAKKISERAVDSQARRVAAGKPNNGGRRTFGYTPDMRIVGPEAALILEAAERVLSGTSVRSVATDWNERGLRTSVGNAWRSTTIRKMLAAPVIAGKRRHRNVITDGSWPPIVDEITHRRLRDLLTDRPPSWSRARKHLLAGLVRCGECDSLLVSGVSKHVHVYRCPPRTSGGCGRVSIRMERLDSLARDLVCSMVDSPQFARSQRARSGRDTARLAADADRLRTKRDDLLRLWRDDVLTAAEFASERRQLDSDLADLERRLSGPEPMVAGSGRSVWERWDAFTVGERRLRVAAVVHQFTVNRGSRPGRWEPERVVPVWKL